MYIKYRIIEAYNQEHIMVVRYFTELFNEDWLANQFNPDGSIQRTPAGYPVRCRTDVSIGFFNKCPTEEDIKMLINRAAPRKFFENLEDDFYGRLDIRTVKDMIGQVGEVENYQIPNR